MCRKHLRLTWLLFLGLIYILGSTDSYLIEEYDEENAFDDYSKYDQDRKSVEESGTKNYLIMSKRDPAFTPYISVGALSNTQQFFENLKENFKSLENLPLEERKSFLGRNDLPAEQETRIFRPPATAAFLHAIRNHRPAHKIKNFAPKDDTFSLRESNNYSPASLWGGRH